MRRRFLVTWSHHKRGCLSSASPGSHESSLSDPASSPPFDMETLVGRAGRNVLDFQPIHPGHRRPASNFFKEPAYELFFPFHDDLYGRFGKIAGPSSHALGAWGP